MIMGKKEVSLEVFEKSVFLLQPGRAILCTTINEDGSNHVAPFSWINPVSFKPPRVGLSLLTTPKKSISLDNIQRVGEFVINLPDLPLAEKLVLTSYDALAGENKFERSGFTPLPAKKVKPVAIEECRAHLECKVIQIMDVGDHDLIIADVVASYYDTSAFSENFLINLNTYKPATHLQSYITDSGQAHVFMEPGGAYVADVPFPSGSRVLRKDEE
jgi:flavin reductase (DIM6/NTAB) family NADH-FMN oxidoreductase RutF